MAPSMLAAMLILLAGAGCMPFTVVLVECATYREREHDRRGWPRPWHSS